ncbi:MAG: CarD family transcriptional regulator, partial [Limnohabitans sp.]
HVQQVISPGEYTVRGGLIDLFPMGSLVPFRLDLFDDEIDSIRTFDPDSQRSLYPVPEVRLLPGREFPMDEAARLLFRSRWRECLEGDPTRSRIYKDMGNGVATAGIEYYLPLFFDETATVFDYLDKNSTVVLHGELEPVIHRFSQDAQERYRLSQGDPERPVLPPSQLFLNTEQFFQAANSHAVLAIKPSANTEVLAWVSQLPDLTVDRTAAQPAAKLADRIQSKSQRVLILAESEGRSTSLNDLFNSWGLSPTLFNNLEDFLNSQSPMGMAVSQLHTGFAWLEKGVDLVTETELFAVRPSQRRKRKQEQVSDVESLIKDLSELQVGDPIVHSSHGIGRYRGLVNMDIGHREDDQSQPTLQEFLHLEYAEKATLYVPVSQLHLIIFP